MSSVTSTTKPPRLHLRLDTGKMNVLVLDAVKDLRAEIARAEAATEIEVVVLEGNATAFCSGLDLATVSAGGRTANELLAETGRLLHDIYASPLRFIAACTGHAVAAGAMLLLVSDVRIGVEGRGKIGFSEVAYGLPLPEVPTLLARDRLDRRFHQAATMHAQLFRPDAAMTAGFLDRVVDAADLSATIDQEVTRMAALDAAAYHETARTVRAHTLERLRSAVD